MNKNCKNTFSVFDGINSYVYHLIDRPDNIEIQLYYCGDCKHKIVIGYWDKYTNSMIKKLKYYEWRAAKLYINKLLDYLFSNNMVAAKMIARKLRFKPYGEITISKLEELNNEIRS